MHLITCTNLKYTNQWILTDIYSCETTTTINIKLFPACQKFSWNQALCSIIATRVTVNFLINFLLYSDLTYCVCVFIISNIFSLFKQNGISRNLTYFVVHVLGSYRKQLFFLYVYFYSYLCKYRQMQICSYFSLFYIKLPCYVCFSIHCFLTL